MRFVLALGCALGGGAGCSQNDVADLCDTSCECASCSDAQLVQCNQESESMRAEAQSRGCGEEIDELVDCLVDESVCSGGELNPGPDRACREEFEVLRPCLCVDVAGSPSALRNCLVD